MGDYLQIQADRSNGMCLLRITGELDSALTGTFAAHAEAVAGTIPGPVTVDLSGLTFIDAAGARALTLVIGTLSGRLAAVSPCTPAVRRVLELSSLPPLDYWLARHREAPGSGTPELIDQVRRVLRDAGKAQSTASGTLARLSDTRIRIASTRERTGLIREQARLTLAGTRALRELLARSRQQAT
jgi:anti-anti-sigma factor